MGRASDYVGVDRGQGGADVLQDNCAQDILCGSESEDMIFLNLSFKKPCKPPYPHSAQPAAAPGPLTMAFSQASFIWRTVPGLSQTGVEGEEGGG